MGVCYCIWPILAMGLDQSILSWNQSYVYTWRLVNMVNFELRIFNLLFSSLPNFYYKLQLFTGFNTFQLPTHQLQHQQIIPFPLNSSKLILINYIQRQSPKSPTCRFKTTTQSFYKYPLHKIKNQSLYISYPTYLFPKNSCNLSYPLFSTYPTKWQ